jgi:hypothetical protein
MGISVLIVLSKKQRKSTKNHNSVKMIFACTNIVTYQNEVETV